MVKYEYNIPSLAQKIRLYASALCEVPFYRYGEIGNMAYTIGKNILDGAILYAMFSMAEKELKIAAVLGVMIKYAYPGIALISSNIISGYIDRIEAYTALRHKIKKLLQTQIGIGIGQALGAIFLLLCYPPVFSHLFASFPLNAHLMVLFYLLHHVCDGSAQIVEGRTWFKIIELSIRNDESTSLSRNFWVIHALSQNIQLLLGQVFLWAALALTTHLVSDQSVFHMNPMVYFGFSLVAVSKFILPVAHRLQLCPLVQCFN